MNFGDRLDAIVTALVANQQLYAMTIAKICLGLFIFNCAAFGFSSVAAPAAAGHFLFGAVMFGLGAVANRLLASNHQNRKEP